MTTQKNREERRRLAAVAAKAATKKTAPSSESEDLMAKKARLLRMQSAFTHFKTKKGAQGSQELILTIEKAPPCTLTLSFTDIQVELSVDDSSVVELGRPHLCRYTEDFVPGAGTPRAATVLFSLRDRQEEINKVMVALRQRQR